MQTFPELFVKQFTYNWKELRKSDPRLAREFGLTISEVRRIKSMLIGNPCKAILHDDEDDTTVRQPEYSMQARKYDKQKLPTHTEESKRSNPQPKGILGAVYTGLFTGTARLGKVFADRMNDLLFEEDAYSRQQAEKARSRQTREEPAPHVSARPGEAIKERVELSMPRAVEYDRPKESTAVVLNDIDVKESEIAKASDALRKVQETVEKAEFEQELERRFTATTGKLLQETPEPPKVSEPIKHENTTAVNEPVVFDSALDEVMYRQALKKFLHVRKEIRCKGIIEIEQIAYKNKTVIYALFPIMQDNEPDVRAQVLISLINLDAKESIFLFKSALNDENARVRMAAIRGIHKFTGRSTGQFLSLAVSDESAEVREITARYIGINSDNVSISTIIELLGKVQDASVRTTLLQTLIAVRDKSTVPCFISMLNDSNIELRKLAACTLDDWTGKNIGFDAGGSLAARERVIEEIKQWWSQVKETCQIRPKAEHKTNQESKSSATGPLIKDNKDKKTHTAGKPAISPESGNASQPADIVDVKKPIKSGQSPHVEESPKPMEAVQMGKSAQSIKSEKSVDSAETPAAIKAYLKPVNAQNADRHPGGIKRLAKLDTDALGLD